MLHDAANRINHVFEASDKRSFLPTSGVAFDTHPIGSSAQSSEAHAIVVLRNLARRLGIESPEDQVIPMNPDRHTGSNGMMFDKLGELPLGTLHG